MLHTLPSERTTETPAGGVIAAARIATHAIDASTAWSLWRSAIGPQTLGVHIELAVHAPSAGWRTWTEGTGFPRDDCPLAYLDQTTPLDREWRDRVWSWHEAQLAADVDQRD